MTAVDCFAADELRSAFDTRGYAICKALLTPSDCRTLRDWYDDAARFRARVDMAKYQFGRGEYQYFANPLPDRVTALRNSAYPALARIANEWQQAMKSEKRFPTEHRAYLEQCHAAGQERPTPLMLRYGPGDFNRLHQDLYGDEVFPLQLAVLLSVPGSDFSGGEFVLTEQRPRTQSRVEVVPLLQGDAVIFPVNERPVRGARGYYRVRVRHGVSVVGQGERFALGIIFHDAR